MRFYNTYYLKPFFAVMVAIVFVDEKMRVFEDLGGGSKVDAMLIYVDGVFMLIPFKFHKIALLNIVKSA